MPAPDPDPADQTAASPDESPSDHLPPESAPTSVGESSAVEVIPVPTEDAERIQAFRQWHADLRLLTPYAPVTPILVGINVLVFVAMAASGANPFNPTLDKLLEWGADFGPSTTGGEWWRLVTSAFLHSGLAHLAFNMLCLFGIGRTTERMIGSTGFLLTYLTAAIAGNLASVAWAPAVVSVGASGAVFGVFGAFFAVSIRAADTIPKPALHSFRKSMGKLLAFNLVAGFFISNIDNAAHIGGLVWGFAIGFLLGHGLHLEAARGRMRRNLFALILFAPVFVLGVVIADGRVNEANAAAAESEQIAVEESRILAIYNDAVSRYSKETLSARECAGIIDNDVRPPWRELRNRFAQSRDKFVADPHILRDYENYLSVRGEAFDLVSRAIAKDNPLMAAQAQEKMAEADRRVESLRRGR